MKARLLIAAFWACAALAGTASAAGSGDEDRLREQLRNTVLQLRELQDNQAALQAQKTAAEQQRDALKAKPAVSKAQFAQARRDAATIAELRLSLDKAQADLAQASEATGQAQAGLEQYKGLYAQASEAARNLTADRNRLQATLAATNALLTASEVKNAQLIAVADEILDAYAHVGVRGALLAKEPFIGLKRVKIENIVQAYEDKIRDGRFDPRTVRPPAPAPADKQ